MLLNEFQELLYGLTIAEKAELLIQLGESVKRDLAFLSGKMWVNPAQPPLPVPAPRTMSGDYTMEMGAISGGNV